MALMLLLGASVTVSNGITKGGGEVSVRVAGDVTACCGATASDKDDSGWWFNSGRRCDGGNGVVVGGSSTVNIDVTVDGDGTIVGAAATGVVDVTGDDSVTEAVVARLGSSRTTVVDGGWLRKRIALRQRVVVR